MPAKLSLKLDYKSPFVTFILFGNQKGYRTAWMLNKQLGVEFERINDFKHGVGPSELEFVLYGYYCNKFRMNFFLLENKTIGGAIINQPPVPDYLLLIWNKSEFFDIEKFLKEVRKSPGLQAAFHLDKKIEQKHCSFFHDLEFFLEGKEEI